MIDKTKNETKAMGYAVEQAGEYIEDIVTREGRTYDFTTWSPEEFEGFIESVVDSFAYKMVELGTAEKPPF